jgi:hypothetical protein
MVTAFTTALPPAALPPGSTIVVSIGAGFVIAVLFAALVVVAAVLVQGAVSAPSRRRPALRATPAREASAPSRHAA